MNLRAGDIIIEHGLCATYRCEVISVSCNHALVKGLSATRNGAPFKALGVGLSWYIPLKEINVIGGEYHREIDLPTYREREDI